MKRFIARLFVAAFFIGTWVFIYYGWTIGVKKDPGLFVGLGLLTALASICTLAPLAAWIEDHL